MQIELRSLEEILTTQNQLVEELVQWSRKELEALKKNDFTELAEVIEKQQFLGQKLRDLEIKRLQYQEVAQEKMEIDFNLTLRGLVDDNPDLPESMQTLAGILRKNFEELQELNELNGLLIKQSLFYVQKVLKTVNLHQTIYQPDGRLEQATAKSMLDKSV